MIKGEKLGNGMILRFRATFPPGILSERPTPEPERDVNRNKVHRAHFDPGRPVHAESFET